jgi:hypothetical protein
MTWGYVIDILSLKPDFKETFARLSFAEYARQNPCVGRIHSTA